MSFPKKFTKNVKNIGLDIFGGIVVDTLKNIRRYSQIKWRRNSQNHNRIIRDEIVGGIHRNCRRNLQFCRRNFERHWWINFQSIYRKWRGYSAGIAKEISKKLQKEKHRWHFLSHFQKDWRRDCWIIAGKNVQRNYKGNFPKNAETFWMVE